MVEHMTVNHGVVGSNPTGGAIICGMLPKRLRGLVANQIAGFVSGIGSNPIHSVRGNKDDPLFKEMDSFVCHWMVSMVVFRHLSARFKGVGALVVLSNFGQDLLGRKRSTLD